jgi:hypothetical protein
VRSPGKSSILLKLSELLFSVAKSNDFAVRLKHLTSEGNYISLSSLDLSRKNMTCSSQNVTAGDVKRKS